MNFRKTLLSALILLGFATAGAQTSDSLQLKYDHFRQRLTTEFMYFTGDGSVPGSHLPIERRYMNGDYRAAKWADAVWWQGHYIAVLATEYELKRRNGEKTEATLNELRCALDVYDRLDLAAEECWQADGVLNGFYIRDDVKRDYASLYCADAVGSDYAYYCGKEDATRHAPSQDQAWGSYIGFALVQKFVPDSAVRQHVADITTRMVRGMQFTDEKGRKSWQIVNPVTGKVVQKEGDIQWLQYAHGTIGSMLARQNLHFANSEKGNWKNIWNILQDNVLLDRNGHFTWYGVLSMSAVMNEGGSGNGSCYDWLVKVNDKIVKRNPDMGQTLFFPHLPLLNLALYGTDGKDLLPQEKYIEYLQSAPYNGSMTIKRDGKTERTAAPWHSLSLFCPWHTTETGDGNMLDYMLLHNLYRIVYEAVEE